MAPRTDQGPSDEAFIAAGITPGGVKHLPGNEEMSQKLTTWKNEPSLMKLRNDLEAAKPAHDAWATRLHHWNDLLHVKGAARPKQVKGRSHVQPKLIRRQAEWRYSALTEPFLGSNKLFQVKPATWNDVAGARQNELVLNWQFRTKLNRVKFIDDYVRSCVDEGSAIVQVGWRRITKTVQQAVPVYVHLAIDPRTPNGQQQMAAFQQVLQLSQTDPVAYLQTVDPAMQASIDYYNESQQATLAIQRGTQVVPHEMVIENRPIVDVINPLNFFIDPSCNGDLEKALFAIVSFETNKADLLKQPDRYKNLDLVNWETSTPATASDHATQTPNSFHLQDNLRRRVVAYEYWGFADINGDGELVPIVATWIGQTLIRLERNPFPDQKIPFVVVPYLPIKRELMGEPDGELLEDNQKILGAVTRGMIDLLGRSANSQQGFAKGMLDPLNRRKYESGQDYEFNPNLNPAGGNLIEHKYPELPQSAMSMVQLMNQEAESLTGVKAFSGGISGEAYGAVAAGIRGVLDAASKREMAILRRLAKGVIDIGRKIIAMNAVFLSAQEVVRVTDEQYVKMSPPEQQATQAANDGSNDRFLTVNREDLVGEYDLETDISTAEVDNAQAQDLGFMLQTMGPQMAESDPKTVYLILSKIADLKRMPDLAHMLRNWQPPPPTPQQQMMQQLQLQEAQLKVAFLQSQIDLNKARAGHASSQADLNNLDFVEQGTGTQHAREVDRIQAQGRANQDLEVTKSLLTPQKPEEKKPDVKAAVGFNALTKARDAAQSGSTPVDSTMQRDALAHSDPRYSLGSEYYDPSRDPSANPNVNV